MDISNFFAAVAASFKNRYLDQAQAVAQNRQNANQAEPKTKTVEPAAVASSPVTPVDSYEPSAKVTKPKAAVKAAKSTPNDKPTDNQKTDTPSDDTSNQPTGTNADGTYYYRRTAQLAYELDLRFDLGAILSTAKEIKDGDTASITQLAAAGFGLSAGFDIAGAQIVETNMADDSSAQAVRKQTAASARQAAALAYQNKSFALQSFYKESTDVRSSLQQTAQGAYRRAVNQFALRYRLDNQFSFGYLQKFNLQTQQVANQDPGAVSGYANAAGDLALKGSSDLMSSFFDAVDSYLTDSEAALTDKITQFFEQAAGELGFSEEQIAAVTDHLTDTISGFFDRVQAAVDTVQAAFAPSVAPVSPDAVLPTPEDSQALAVA